MNLNSIKFLTTLLIISLSCYCIMTETAQITCGLSRGPCSHKKAWRRNEEVAKEVREKKKKYENWKKRKIDRGMEEVQEE